MENRINVRRLVVIWVVVLSTMGQAAFGCSRDTAKFYAYQLALGTGIMTLFASPFLAIYGGIKFVQHLSEQEEIDERRAVEKDEAELAARPIDESEGIFPKEYRGRWRGQCNQFYIPNYRTHAGQNVTEYGVNKGPHHFYGRFEMEILANKVIVRKRIYRDNECKRGVSTFTEFGYGPQFDQTFTAEEFSKDKSKWELLNFTAGGERYRISVAGDGKPSLEMDFGKKGGWYYVARQLPRQ